MKEQSPAKKRISRHWTPQEDDLLRQGIIPLGRTYNQAYTHCVNHGINPVFKGMSHRKQWSTAEVAMLEKGVLPKSRSAVAAYNYCLLHGIRPNPAWSPYGGSGHRWTQKELALVEKDIVPPRRTVDQCRDVAKTYFHKEFKPIPPLHEPTEKEVNTIKAMRMFGYGFSFADTAKALKLTRGQVYSLIEQMRKLLFRVPEGEK